MYTPGAKDLGATSQNSAHHADQDLVGHTELRSRSRNQRQMGITHLYHLIEQRLVGSSVKPRAGPEAVVEAISCSHVMLAIGLGALSHGRSLQ